MQVDVGEMRAGANRSYSAAALAMEGADQLNRVGGGVSIFGGFPAAESFHGALSEADSNHIQRLREHEDHLGVLGDKGHKTASVFLAMEERHAEALRSVQ
ncbi:DUF2563 family protein [Mycolicibacterium helvum]|uniref:Uncharacterized protein n=1 Tax=Mycolicibacterium helvum TaxID=1534349 RepID=A0A7I7T3R5_9MYCO|nr:DUF2563 family protein [Mycolicibacterium helvum]BBY63513.1 hypothetical protein MHEL_17560 [Mycolicibacterium helvum]